MTDDHDVLTRQRGDGRRDGVAGDHETVVDARVADEPEDLLDEPVHRVHVGHVDEAAQEHDVAPATERGLVRDDPAAGRTEPAEGLARDVGPRAAWGLVQDRHGVDLRAGHLAQEQVVLERAHHDGGVRGVDQAELHRPHVGGAVRVGPGDGLLAGHPQVVEVDRQEDHLGGRRHVADAVDDVEGDGRPVEQGHVTGGGQPFDGLAQLVVVVDPGDRDPEVAQGARVGILGIRDGGEERDLEPGRGQDLQVGVRVRRPGVAIRGGQRVVDQQEALTHARIVATRLSSFGIRSNRCSIPCHTGPVAGGMNKRGGHGYGTMAERIAATKAAAHAAALAARPAGARTRRPQALLGAWRTRPGSGVADRVASYGGRLARARRPPGPRPRRRGRLDPGRGVAAGGRPRPGVRSDARRSSTSVPAG